MSTRERDIKIDFVRCVSNYLVVILHAWAAFQYVSWGGVEFIAWTTICSHLCWLALPAFFMISGYLLFYGYSLEKFPTKIESRFKRLFVPYVVWNVFFVIFYLSLAHFVPRLSTRVATFGLDSFGGAFSKILSLTVGPIDGPLWFLRVIFLLALASPLIWLAINIWRGLPLLLLSVGWCVAEPILELTALLHLTAPAYAVACFVLGGVVAANKKDMVPLFKNWLWLALGLVACSVRACVMIPSLLENAKLLVCENVLVSLLSIMEAPALICLVAHINVDRIVKNRVYNFLKEMSFFAYAGHFLFCSMWLHAVAPLMRGQWPGKFTLLILVFVVCGIATMALAYKAGKCLFPRLMKLFDGTL